MPKSLLIAESNPVGLKRCLIGFAASLITFFLVILAGGLLLSDDLNAWSGLSVVAFVLSSLTLKTICQYKLSLSRAAIPIIVIAVIAAICANYLNYLTGSTVLPHKTLTVFYSYSELRRVIYLAIVCIFTPILEEIYFRGLLFPILSTCLGAIAGGAISALVFIVAHLPANVVLITIVYTWLAYRSKSVVPSIVAHIAYNSIFFYLALSGI